MFRGLITGSFSPEDGIVRVNIADDSPFAFRAGSRQNQSGCCAADYFCRLSVESRGGILGRLFSSDQRSHNSRLGVRAAQLPFLYL